MMSNEIDIPISSILAPAFLPIHKHIRDENFNEIWLKGGRGSTKSSFTSIQIILGIMKDPDANALILRKVGDTVRKSVFANMLWAIDTLKATSQFTYTIAPPTITYTPTGQQILMSGLDDPQKLKSIKARKGYFKFLWFEEANDFNGMDEIRSVEQSVLRGGDKFVEFITYNPPNDPNAWVNKESTYKSEGRVIHSSTYLDVPKEWLGEHFVSKALELKERDPEKYRHEYMGEAVGRAEQIVFHGKWIEKAFETPEVNLISENKFFYGADWGFANDPTAILRAFIMHENGKKNLYIDYEAGGTGIEFEDLPALFDKIPESRKWKMYGDSARPETVSYMARQGFRIKSVPKWKGSVEDGIEYLKSFDKIIIHPRCTKLIEEMMKYSYKVDRITQEILPVLEDAFNHYIDALRYAMNDYIQKKGNGFFM